jgi:hypothetical protein
MNRRALFLGGALAMAMVLSCPATASPACDGVAPSVPIVSPYDNSVDLQALRFGAVDHQVMPALYLARVLATLPDTPESSNSQSSEAGESISNATRSIDMSVRAKMFVASVNPYKHIKNDGTEVQAATVTLYGVYKGVERDGRTVNGCPENEIFGEATPGATLTMSITNPKAHEQLVAGKQYYIDISEASPA